VLAIAMLVSVVDQATKAHASGLRLLAVQGRVVANQYGMAGILVLDRLPMIILASALLLAMVVVGPRILARGKVSAVGLGLLVGGSLGNLIDRIWLGHVRDFIWIPAFVINLADVALIAGALVVVVQVSRRSNRYPTD
jgi:signal peptidase II